MRIKIMGKETLKKGIKLIKKKVIPFILTGSIILGMSGCTKKIASTNPYDNTAITSQEENPVDNQFKDTTIEISSQASYNPDLHDDSEIRDISGDYEYLYVGDSNNITIDSNNFIEYKNTDNAFTRSESNFIDDIATITDSDLKEYTSYVKSINSEIAYSDLFNLEELITKKEKETNNINHSYDFPLMNGKIDAQNLLEVVTSNNKEYGASDYKKLDNKTLQKCCQIITDVLNENIEKNSYVDIEALKCNLGSLKIFSEQNVTNARITYDNVLTISSDMIKNLQNLLEEDVDAYELTIAHEAEHLMQINCDDEVDKTRGNKIGFTEKWDDEPINSLFWKWYYESSAETLMTDKYNCDNIVYENMTNYLKFITLAESLNPNFTSESLEEVSVSRNPNDFYNLFNAKTLEEKTKIAKIMYSIEIIQNQPTDFQKIYLNYLNSSSYTLSVDEWGQIKQEIKVGLCLELSKIFYQNLANYINTNDIKLNEIYYIITVFEAELEQHIVYDSLNKYDNNQIFMDEYTKLQQSLFNLIITQKNYSYEQILSGFNSFSLDCIMNLDKKEMSTFIKNRQKELINCITTNINITNQTLKKQLSIQKGLILK